MTNVTRLPSPLTVTERAIIDLQQEFDRMAQRLKVLGVDPAVPQTEADKKADHPWSPEMVAELTRPVRIDISFDDPVKTRQQLEALMATFVEAQAISQDHAVDSVRQRLRMRHTVKTGADVVTCMNGKRPRGHRS